MTLEQPLTRSSRPTKDGSSRTGIAATARAGTRGAQTSRRLEPVDCAEEVPLSQWYTAMTQDVVRCRYKEEEIWQGKLLQIVVAPQLPVVATASPGDNL